MSQSPEKSRVSDADSLAEIAAALARIADRLAGYGAVAPGAGAAPSALPTPITGTPPPVGCARCRRWRAYRSSCSRESATSRETLLQNTLHFARGHGANNALLWGARGMGKSSLVKALHAHVNGLGEAGPQRLILIEINREDIESLPRLMRMIAPEPARFIVFCDDLSLRQGRDELQVAENHPRRRPRGPAGRTCCSMPPPTAGT